MPRPNLPASAADIGRLVARVERLERLYRAAGPRTFGELDDVDAIDPADGTVATYVGTTGKIEMQPAPGSGFPLNNGTATFDQQMGSVAGASEMLTSVTDNATGASSQVLQSVDNAGHASTVLKAIDGSGNYTEIAINTLGQIIIGGHTLPATILLGNSGDAIDLSNLPTTDPGISGEAWNDSGTVKVSP